MPTITIVAKTGFLIETRVIHMAVFPRLPGQPATCVVPEVGAEAGSGAVDGAFTTAGAPSLRLSKRAASTRADAGSVVRISTRSAALSRPPVTTLRFTSLPSSSVQTNACPASVRSAVAGSVGTGAPEARAIRPVANMPPRSDPSAFGIPT